MKPWRTLCDLGHMGAEIHEFDDYAQAMDFARECRAVAVARGTCDHCEVLDLAGRVVWDSFRPEVFEQYAGVSDLGEGIYRYHEQAGWRPA